MTDRLAEALARGPVVLDAAMGTRLVSLGLDLAQDDPVFWNLSHPEAVGDLHARDAAAGADALVANTFGANRAWLRRWGRELELESTNRRAVQLARAAAGQSRLVIGSIGPTAVGLPGAAHEQAEVLADAGVDALVFETYRFDQAEAALRETRNAIAVPLLVSLVDWPAPADAAARCLGKLGASVLGVNCQLNVARALTLIESLLGATDLPLLAKPGAGRPGEPLDSPADFAHVVPRMLECGVRLLGGCCGTTDAHVAALRAACYDTRAWPTRYANVTSGSDSP